MSNRVSRITERLAEADQQAGDFASDFWPDQFGSTDPIIRDRLQKIGDELGDDAILAEAALNWIRRKKREIQGTTLGVLYTREELEEMQRRAAEQDETE